MWTSPTTRRSSPREPDTTRSVAEENTASDDNIGTAVTATDADTSDTLTYTLGGTDASSFDIEPNSGQIKKKSGVTYNYEAKPSYAVTVSVSDGNGGADSINVTINVTSDRAALIALYNATDGANWTDNTNWLSNEASFENGTVLTRPFTVESRGCISPIIC